MEYLLDTNALIQILFDSEKVPGNIKEIINDEQNDIFVSFASLWEIAIKSTRKSKKFPITYRATWNAIVSKTDFRLLSLHDNLLEEYEDIVNQQIHKDPFDLMLLSLTKHEEFTIITTDKVFCKYENVDVLFY